MTSSITTGEEPEYIPAICIGAGVSGICTGVQLQRKLGLNDFHIYDTLDDFGGTWQANTYPGCGCDVPAIVYTFSFALDNEWTRAFPPQAEVLEYLKGVANKYGLRERTTFGTACLDARWDESRSRWCITLQNLASKKTFLRECSILISAVGILAEPMPVKRVADFGAFSGKVFHSARWDHSVDLRGKDVVVIGNGCTGIQLVPNIAPLTRSLTHIVRTGQWIIPMESHPPSPLARWTFSNVPFATWLFRLLVLAYAELTYLIFPMNALASILRRRVERVARAFVHTTAPAKYHADLIPKHEIACRRRVFDTAGYMKCLNAPNVRFVVSPRGVREILPTAVRTDDDVLHRADVVILATGFDAVASVSSFNVVGRGGTTLREHWDVLGGPGAYDTVACAGFPNFFMISGPNSLSGYASVVPGVENEVDLTLRLVQPILQGRAKAVEVSAQEEIEFVTRAQRQLRRMVWSGPCSNWYESRNRWNFATYPWSQLVIWWRCQFPNLAAWKYS